MDRMKVKEFREDLNNVLKTLEAKYEMSITVGTITYSPDMVRTSIEGRSLSLPSKRDEKTDRLESDFRRYCGSYGLKPDDLGKTNKEGKKLIGLDMMKDKYRIIFEQNGRQYKTNTFRM
jgi:hypothetical protein